MAQTLLLIPVSYGAGLTSVCAGLVRALDRRSVAVAYVKPLSQPESDASSAGPDRSTELIRLTTSLDPPEPVSSKEVEGLLSAGDEELLLERVVGRVDQQRAGADIVVVEGLVPNEKLVYSTRINARMAAALDARVILVGRANGLDTDAMAEQFNILATVYDQGSPGRVAGCIINRVHAGLGPAPARNPVYSVAPFRPIPAPIRTACSRALEAVGLKVLAMIPEEPALTKPRVVDVARALDAKAISMGEMGTRRVFTSVVGAMTAPNFIDRLGPGTLVVTPGDRSDLLMAACLSELSGTQQAGVLLTSGIEPPESVLRLCRAAFDWGLPVLATKRSTSEASKAVFTCAPHCPTDDKQRAERIMNHVAQYVSPDFLDALISDRGEAEVRMSPPAFRYRLIESARAANKRIVLPEGEEPRTITAAAICQERGIARCVLLGEPDTIHKVAAAHNVALPEGIEILRPADMIEEYVAPMVELRKKKNLSPVMARDQLEDPVVLGTMMLAQGHVDGLVSGAVHTTANTVRPALRLIKTAPGSSLVSSLFFMCLPNQVLIYGDCAVNPDPTAEQLAEIALQCAQSAKDFGIPPRVSLLSYSTGSSGAGQDVSKVVEAVRIAKERAPDLPLDGPLQYDAALIPEVARQKAPNSPVAGRTTVFIFPDLDAGNMTYKAVQRAANVVSIGPMLQGLAKPVNDLSRGCLVEDIVYTIALTAIQAAAADSA